MKLLALTSAIILAAAVVPAMAEGNSPAAAEQSQQMKGPPNANGMKSDNGMTKMQSGRSDSGTSNSMPSGSATGTGKQ